MKSYSVVALVLMSLVSSPSWGLTLNDLVETNGLYYQKFTNVPFTGKVKGRHQGKFRKGRREGLWSVYHKNGRLSARGRFDGGEEEGTWEYFRENGSLERKGDFENGKRQGTWTCYWENGQILGQGHVLNDQKHGDWKIYDDDGRLFSTTSYKNGEREPVLPKDGKKFPVLTSGKMFWVDCSLNSSSFNFLDN